MVIDTRERKKTTRQRLRRFYRRLRPDPLTRPPKGGLSFWSRARRLIWSWWIWAFIGVWVAADGRWIAAAALGVVAVFMHLTAPREKPPRYGLDHEFEIDSEEFLSSIVGATGVPFSEGNDVRLLNNGDEFYPEMLAAIDEAEASITIEAYIYWEGEIGRRFAAALAAKARAGIRVKILLDAIGSATIGREILQILKAGGCQIAWYNPIHWYTLDRFNNRTHRKSLIIDGVIAFTGGAGIADQWLGDAQDPDHWRDTQIRIEGAGVKPLQTGFAGNWLQTTGELISGIEYYPPAEAAGRLAVQTILSSPETGSSTVRVMYYLSIVCARRKIYIANPYFIPDEAGIEVLIDARRRGVDVKVMISGRHIDNWLARQNSVRLYGPLLEAGVEIYEYNRTMLHQKTMVIDGLWATVGTTNFDNRSFAHNEENNVCIYDADFARELEQTFMADLDACDRVELDAWRRRGLLAKAQGFVASLLKDQV